MRFKETGYRLLKSMTSLFIKPDIGKCYNIGRQKVDDVFMDHLMQTGDACFLGLVNAVYRKIRWVEFVSTPRPITLISDHANTAVV